MIDCGRSGSQNRLSKVGADCFKDTPSSYSNWTKRSNVHSRSISTKIWLLISIQNTTSLSDGFNNEADRRHLGSVFRRRAAVIKRTRSGCQSCKER